MTEPILWQPIPCPATTENIVWSDYGLQFQCSLCWQGADTPEEIRHARSEFLMPVTMSERPAKL